METPDITIRQLAPKDWKAFKKIRLEALRKSGAFEGRYELESQLSNEQWRQRLSGEASATFGAVTSAGKLVGILRIVELEMRPIEARKQYFELTQTSPKSVPYLFNNGKETVVGDLVRFFEMDDPLPGNFKETLNKYKHPADLNPEHQCPGFYLIGKLSPKNAMEIGGSYIRPAYRGEYLSYKLWEACFEHAFSQDKEYISSSARETSKETLKTFKALGFEQEGFETSLHVDGPRENSCKIMHDRPLRLGWSDGKAGRDTYFIGHVPTLLRMVRGKLEALSIRRASPEGRVANSLLSRCEV